MDSGDEEYYNKKLRTKGKTQSYLPKAVCLDLVHRARNGKCVGGTSELSNFNENKTHTENSQVPKSHIFIINDIWLHLAKYIAPDDVKDFSLICSQSAKSINCRSFWLHMYSRYCQQSVGNSKKWVLDLPEDLQLKHLKDCDRNSLKQKVVQALYKCYPPFKIRLNTPYTLDSLVGRIYVSSWYKLLESFRIMCFKFQLSIPQAYGNNKSQVTKISRNNIINNSDNIADSWECLADETNNWCHKNQSYSTSSTDDLDGVFILIVCSKQFSPFPTDIICSQDTNLLRFSAGRELLSSDMVTKTIELDFVSSASRKAQTVTLKYLQVHNIKVIPWWHPDFNTFIKCA